MDNLVSIIVPAYNAEQFISKCVESILNQSYTNFELIIVDDGSIDRSWDIITDFARKDNRISVFHQENRGAGAARNAGLKKADGEWIVFIDADDYIDKHFLSSIIPIRNDVDLVLCGYKSIKRNGGYSISKLFNKEVPVSNFFIYTLKDIYHYTNMYIWCGPVCKVFSKKIINNNHIEFPTDTNFGEDSIFVAKYLLYVIKIQFVESYFYNVVSNSYSLTANVNLDKLFPSYVSIHKLTLDFCKKQEIIDLSTQESYYMDRLLYCANIMRKANNHKKYKQDRLSCYQYVYKSPYKSYIINQLPKGFNFFGKFNLWNLYDFLLSLIH
jgi:glycosyltransferase involved in cell wall biosynthesis